MVTWNNWRTHSSRFYVLDLFWSGFKVVFDLVKRLKEVESTALLAGVDLMCAKTKNIGNFVR